LLKEMLFPAIQHLKDCLKMTHLMLSNVTIKKDILNDEKYKFLFSVEEVNKLVLSGVPFRDAYKKVGLDIEGGKYNPETTVNHTHEGSIGNLNLKDIERLMMNVVKSFDFEKVERSVGNLLNTTK
jgi:argininosuccinate lyase